MKRDIFNMVLSLRTPNTKPLITYFILTYLYLFLKYENNNYSLFTHGCEVEKNIKTLQKFSFILSLEIF